MIIPIEILLLPDALAAWYRPALFGLPVVAPPIAIAKSASALEKVPNATVACLLAAAEVPTAVAWLLVA